MLGEQEVAASLSGGNETSKEPKLRPDGASQYACAEVLYVCPHKKQEGRKRLQNIKARVCVLYHQKVLSMELEHAWAVISLSGLIGWLDRMVC